MRILILGGTVFLGRHVAEEALARGHEVTVYSRGLHGAAPAGTEHVRGDRADLAPLQGRAWDAVVDTSGYAAPEVAASSALDAPHYVFVSTCNVYPSWPDEPVDEDSPVWLEGDGYGEQKAACERLLPAGRSATVRAGLIVGPHDNIFRLPWWVKRLLAGGPVPAPGRPDRSLQVIDARDLAAFLLELGERRVSGVFNGTAPIGQTTMGELLAGGDLRWIPEDRLEAAGVEPWMELPLWMPERYAGTWNVGTERAQAAGLRCRPVAETLADVAAWLRAGGEAELTDWRAQTRPRPMSAEREAELLALA